MAEQNSKEVELDIRRVVESENGAKIISYYLYITNLGNNFIQLLEIQVNDNKMGFDVNILDEGAEIPILLGQTGAVTQRQGVLPPYICRVRWKYEYSQNQLTTCNYP